MKRASEDWKENFISPKIEPYGDDWRLIEDWSTDCKGLLPELIEVKKGFITDGASIPRWLWTICGSPMDIPRLYAAIVHDWMYDHAMLIPETNEEGLVVWKECTRAKADEIYRDFQIKLGRGYFKSYTEWLALRTFGWSHWHTGD